MLFNRQSLGIAGLTAMVVASSSASPAYYNPADGGGSMLANNIGSSSGEPINVIVSGSSDPAVLTSAGFLAYMQSIDFSGECLGLSQEPSLAANLGDGRNSRNATATLRYNFGNPSTGTCRETAEGGNHLRYWQQIGRAANSSAWFLAVSAEQNLTLGHNILPGPAGANGYDLGRDWLAGNATAGSTQALGYSFTTTSSSVTGLLEPGSTGINHGISIDGVVTLLTVRATAVPSNSSSSVSVSAAQPSSSGLTAPQQQTSGALRAPARWLRAMVLTFALGASATTAL